VTRDAADERMLALADAYRTFAAVATDYPQLLRTVARTLTELVGDATMVSLATADGAWATDGATQAVDLEAERILSAALASGLPHARTGLAGRVVATGDELLVPHIDPDELANAVSPTFAGAVRALGIYSFLCVPLAVPGRCLGALSLFRYRPGQPPFTALDAAFVRSISDHAAMSIANAQLFESLQRELAERKRAEERTKIVTAIVENSLDLIATADLDGRLSFINPAGRRLIGVPPEQDITAFTLADFVPPEGVARTHQLRQNVRFQGESWLRNHATGELIPTHVSSFLVRDDDTGEPQFFAAWQRDLRETKRLEAELRQAQKMEALGRLAGGVAHDFNNLLTVILSYCSILTKALPPDSRSARDVEQIDRAAERAAELTRQLLAFSRRQVLAPRPLELGAAVRATEGMIRRLIGEDIELRIITAADADAVMADAGQIEQVVMNLVVNARDAMRGGGVLTVETARDVLAQRNHLGLAAGRYNTLAISDTGVGIDDAAKAHLFEPFFTTKDPGKGTGLGLSTVMGIVQQSGGAIDVTSAIGSGATFRVYLPAIDHAAVVDVAVPRTPTPVHGIQRILVVEDEEQVRMLMCDALRGAGYDVIDARDGEHALEVAVGVIGEIHLLITDVIMPRLGGRALAARFASARPAARVLYMSGYADDKLGHHGVLDPDVDLIQKPLTPAALLRRVRQVLT
jgi:PAS domain S-box-containing protein